MQPLPHSVSSVNPLIWQETSLASSALAIWLLPDLASGGIWNLEFTLHSSQIVLLPKPLWYYGFLLLHLRPRPLSNTKHIGAIILLNRVRILMIQVDVSLTPGASQFVHFLLVARSSITHYTLSMKSLTLVSSVSILIQYNEKLPIFYRDIYTSNNCHLQQQLDCLVRSDIFGRYKSCLGLGEDKPLCYTCWSSSLDHVQFIDFYKVTYQITPPPFSQFGTCSASFPEINNKCISLLMHWQVLACSRIWQT